MKSLLLLIGVLVMLISCKQSSQNGEPAKRKIKDEDTTYLLTKNGLGPIKAGMKKDELEKILGQAIVLRKQKEEEITWLDTAEVKYKDLELELYFHKAYSENESPVYELSGLSTKSTLCRTNTGLHIGSTKQQIIDAYPEYVINMGPESVQVNDTTWRFSTNKYFIRVNDEAWDKHLEFRLTDNKVVSIAVGFLMAE